MECVAPSKQYGEYSHDTLIQLAKVILYFARYSSQNMYKTKLNKLLFYAQFLYYKIYRYRLIDTEFIKDYYGPVLNDLDDKLDILKKANLIELRKDPFGEVVLPVILLKENAYSKKELEVLEIVRKQFDNYSSRKISQYSHEESLWLETDLKEIIEIERANELRDFV
ncbi:Panacea domain-containing protein [Vallitalea guaymasensis]|uniref:Panacea domain-containing protein n=1 Tax=Vallitalea guaymasensis TaxID=1185412 RepID=UPI00235625A4|nr:Panacea domain-containing protein [Vallitalea guaymasensis]